MNRTTWAAAGVALALLGPSALDAQIARSVGEVEDGVVRFTFPTKPEVEICDQGIRMGDDHIRWSMRDGRYDAGSCGVGSAEVELEVRNGLVRDVEVVRSLDDRSRNAVDVGEVSADDAVQYLLSLAYDGATADGAEEAIFPAMLADSDRDWWRDLLAIARDRSVHDGVRKTTLFWLGQAAAEAATAGLTDVALDEDEEQDIRDAAIFAISQRPNDQAVPILMQIARTGDQAETRRKAMFWLAQSEDDRVVEFFEQILLGRNR